jgi:SAM-dependent methyltransferase
MPQEVTQPNLYITDPERKWSRVNLGNLESNIAFLNKTGVLDQRRSVLEIGSGRGSMLRWLVEQGHDTTGIDLDAEFVAECRSANLNAIQALGDDLPFEVGTFDAVLSFDVFEHIADSDRHVEEVRRVLKPGGWYLFQTPNRWTNIPYETVRWTREFGIRQLWVREFLKPPEHCALHNYWQLRKRLESHGFSATFYDIPVVNRYFEAKMKKTFGLPGVLALRLLNPDRLPLPLRTNFYVAASKK